MLELMKSTCDIFALFLLIWKIKVHIFIFNNGQTMSYSLFRIEQLRLEQVLFQANKKKTHTQTQIYSL